MVQTPDGRIRWWTFAGGIANAILAAALKPHFDVTSDNGSLSFQIAASMTEISERLDDLVAEMVLPNVCGEAMDGLKFSECLSPSIAAEVFASRFDDRVAIHHTLNQPRRLIISGSI